MKIEVVVKPNSRKESVEKISETSYKVAVNAPAQEGRANEAVIEALSQHFKIAKSRIQLLRGQTSKKKLLEIDL